MFFVFGYNGPAEHDRIVRRFAHMKDPADQQKAIAKAFKSLKGKPLHEFAMPDTAEQYAKVLRGTPGFKDVSVKARVLTPPPQERGQSWRAMGQSRRFLRRRCRRADETARAAGRQRLCAARGDV